MKQTSSTHVQNELIDLGQRIAIARKARGQTQSDLAQMAGIGLSTMVAMEKGAEGVAIGKVFCVMNALGLLAQSQALVRLSEDPMVTEAGIRSLEGPAKTRSKRRSR